MMTDSNRAEPGLAMKMLKSFGPWLIIGFIVGVSVSLLDKLFGLDIPERVLGAFGHMELDASQGIATAIGLMLIFAGVVGALAYLSPRMGIKMKVYADRQDWQDQRGLYQMSALGCLAWGGMMLLLATSHATDLVNNMPLLGLMIAFVVALLVSFWRLMVVFDELWQQINAASCVFAFYGALAVGGGWSALAHLGKVAPLAPLDWISLLTGFSLIGAIYANGRFGLLEEQL